METVVGFFSRQPNTLERRTGFSLAKSPPTYLDTIRQKQLAILSRARNKIKQQKGTHVFREEVKGRYEGNKYVIYENKTV